MQFKKGQVPWNKGTKGIMKPNSGTFKKGQRAGEKNNTWKGGQQYHQDGVYSYLGVGQRIRRARKNWTDAHGEIPSGYIIHHRDGDKYNDDLANLELISRAELLKRNQTKKHG